MDKLSRITIRQVHGCLYVLPLPDNMIAPNLCRELHKHIAYKANIPALSWGEADANTFQQGR